MQLGVREVSKLLNVSEKTIYRWVGQGILPAYRVNEQYRFNRAELLEWATSRKMNVSAAVFDEPESNSTPIPGLVEALQAGGIFYRLSGADRRAPSVPWSSTCASPKRSIGSSSSVCSSPGRPCSPRASATASPFPTCEI